jgi:hypothetical protein
MSPPASAIRFSTEFAAKAIITSVQRRKSRMSTGLAPGAGRR